MSAGDAVAVVFRNPPHLVVVDANERQGDAATSRPAAMRTMCSSTGSGIASM